MDAVDVFKTNANQALGELGQLAQELADKQAQRERLDEIGRRFDEMGSDGRVDANELDELIEVFEANGLDTTGLRNSSSEELNKLVHERLDVAKDASTLTTTEKFRLQLAMQALGDNVRAASEVSGARHRAYMSVIRNLIA